MITMTHCSIESKYQNHRPVNYIIIIITLYYTFTLIHYSTHVRNSIHIYIQHNNIVVVEQVHVLCLFLL